MRIRERLSRLYLFFLGILMISIISGCGRNQTQESGPSAVDSTIITYDSADTAVLVAVDTENMTLSFLNTEVDRQYTLTYSKTTTITDRYGKQIATSQLKIGDIVDITFLKNVKQLVSMQIAQNAWYYEDVAKYSLAADASDITIGQDTYRLYEDLVIASEDKLIDFADLNPKDILTVVGIDRTVYSLMISTGHGYISLVNEDSFIGGWLELGTTIVPIREGMLLTLTEGEYDAYVSYNGTTATLPVQVTRNEETQLDLGSIHVEEAGTGTVIFTVTPSNAEVYIDSVKTDISEPVVLTTGIHQIILQADGYLSTTKYMKVGTITSTVDFVMEAIETDEDTKESDSESTDTSTGTQSGTETGSETGTGTGTTQAQSGTAGESTGTSTGTTTETGTNTGFLVYLQSPENVEVYIDGTYLGITPISFPKKEGEYIITLRASGYQTRSYMISIDASEKDESYTFANLVQSTN